MNDTRTAKLRPHRDRHTKENFEGAENDTRTRELRRELRRYRERHTHKKTCQHRERHTYKRTSTAPRTTHAQEDLSASRAARVQENFDGTEKDTRTRLVSIENDTRTRELRRHREGHTHKKTCQHRERHTYKRTSAESKATNRRETVDANCILFIASSRTTQSM
ncbi:hypothetical protein PoB_002706100 [Plakobranchus ocellatus]|uniref:Uncharacterized protein n=1 Tax=Plakobranchus ocellatus TaxID=259542 RepID=A0AAV4A1E7_9GAST|nr:hypothetical protein PoB_002706100 [Plakobranchus ocellatus]